MTMELNNEYLKVAILSDLHCHEFKDVGRESFLFAGLARSPANNHPTAALLETIKNEDLQCDVVAIPGDITNKVDRTGFEYGWNTIKEVSAAIKSNLIIATVGNHDIDSRKAHSSDPFSLAKDMFPDFPCGELAYNQSYWAHGFSIIDRTHDRFIIVNSAKDHHDFESAVKGTFCAASMERLEEALKKLPGNKPSILVLHHHPILHTIANMGNKDILDNGDALLSLVIKYGCKFVIHGHRHVPRLVRHTGGSGERINIFGAGSFSKILNEIGSVARNLFHVVYLDKNSGYECGWINTWEFGLGRGWTRATHHSANLPFHCGISLKEININDVSKRVSEIFSSQNSAYLEAGVFKKSVRELFLLNFHEQTELAEILKIQYGLKVVVEPDGTFEGLGRLRP